MELEILNLSNSTGLEFYPSKPETYIKQKPVKLFSMPCEQLSCFRDLSYVER